MNGTDEQRVRQRLHEELGALEISPAPVPRVTGRGRGIRARRRTLVAGTTLAAVLAVALAALVDAQQPRAPGTVTMDSPGPGGGVFASGITNGKPWRLAVRNVVASPGAPWCLPAVMLNGQDGGILGVPGPHPPSILNGGVLTDPPGQPGAGFGFQQWSADVTRVVYRFPSGQRLDQRPVAVTECGQRFLISGYSFTQAGSLRLTIYTRHGRTETHFPLPDTARPWPPGQLRGLWSVASSVPATSGDIGSGTAGRSSWTIKQTLGLGGQCYTSALRGQAGGSAGQDRVCHVVSLPPAVTTLDRVPLPAAGSGFTAYAGLVNPRAAKVIVSIDNGTSLTIRPVNVAGRAYIAFVVPPSCRAYLLGLYDRAGHMFASTTALPQAG